MNKMTEEPTPVALFPAPLHPALESRFLAAMQAVSVEEGTVGELELRLRQLSPAIICAAHEGNLLAAMQQHVAEPYRAVGGRWRRVSRWSAAAALVALCVSAGLVFVNGWASAPQPAGYASRCVTSAHAGGRVEWYGGQMAVCPYEIHYEDSFILDEEEGSTITVRVPNRTQLMLEAEVI